MPIAKSQITIVDLHDGVDGTDGSTYILNILNGTRTFTYNTAGSTPTPAQSAFSCELIRDGSVVTPSKYTWSATGHLSGTASTATFTPTARTTYSSSLGVSDTVSLTAEYNGQTLKVTVPIAVTKLMAGTDAKLVTLVPSGLIFKKATGGVTTTPTTITVTGTTQNTAITAWTYSVDNGDFLATLPAGVTINSNVVTVTGQSMTATTISIKATDGTNSDVITVTKMVDGVDGKSPVSGYLTNESLTLPATSTGTVSGLPMTVGTFKVFDGLTDKTGSGVTYALSSNTGCTASIASTGVITLNSLTADNATAVFTATYGTPSVVITKTLTISKSKAGTDATTYYTWVKYADTPTTGMSDSPTGKSYIGLAYNKTTSTKSSVYADYSWSLIKGDKGLDGTTYYTWVKYADTPTSGMADTPDGKRYIGIAVNKTTATKSSVYADYTWSPLYDNVVVGGRNYFKQDTSVGYLSGTNTITKTLEDNGFNVASTVTSSVRVSNVIMDNGDWTVSGFVKASVPMTLLCDICDNSAKNIAVTTSWSKFSFSSNILNYSSDIYHFVDIANIIPGTVEFKDFKVERGNIATDWTPAPEDVETAIEDKASKGDVNTISEKVGDLEDEILLKADLSALTELKLAHERAVIEAGTQKAKTEGDLITLGGRTTAVENKLGDMTEVWEFISTSITFGNEGIFIAVVEDVGGIKQRSTTGVLIAKDRISFMDKGSEIAYISGKQMQISSGIFVQNLQVGIHKIETIPGTDITIFSYVG